MTGRSVPEQPDVADQPNKLRERGPEAAPLGDEPSPEAEPAGVEPRPEAEPAGVEPRPEAAPVSDEPNAEAEAPPFPSLVFQRDRERGPWTRLSASDAAQALGGPW